MKRQAVGILGILIGGLVLSLELYGLKLLQLLEKQTGSWYTSPWSYAKELPCALALLVSVGVITVSIVLYLKREQK